MSENIYKGVDDNGASSVTINGEALDPALDVLDISGGSFSWGATEDVRAAQQLALAILVKEYGPDISNHPRSHYEFYQDVLIMFEEHGFELTSSEIREFASFD